ncbi:hypothetical protein ACIREO_29845 [Streptomyces sp. NPDC102441]|uniref:hypothetical protein n=1 Tax=Streptomyces sp. NPDC102441 TaxID=3366176 RepID=UPI0037F330C5
MLRIHFTAGDLEYVRIARRPDPLWEIVCSVCRLQNKEGFVAFGPWRPSIAGRLRAEGPARRTARFLCGLVPYGPYFRSSSRT